MYQVVAVEGQNRIKTAAFAAKMDAKEYALKRVDDALPNNTQEVVNEKVGMLVGYAFWTPEGEEWKEVTTPTRRPVL